MFGNFNHVIRASFGKYILKLDADDLVDPEYVVEQVAVLEANPKITFAHCACRLIDVNGKIIGYERSIYNSFIRSGIQEWPRYVFGPRAVNIVTIRRSAFDQVGGYDERYRYSGDWAMHRALLKIGFVFYNDHVIASYRSHRVGKAGVRLLQAKEHLMHLEDMERTWPEEVGNKKKMLKRARHHLGMNLVQNAAFATADEQREILALLPSYGSNIWIWLSSILIMINGDFLIRAYKKLRLLLRQVIKRISFSFLKIIFFLAF
jgi:hypothetical protein